MIAFDVPFHVSNPVQHQQAVTALVNRERGTYGLRPLLFAPSLRSSARRWALVQTRLSHFGHGDFDRRALRFPFLLRRPGMRVLGENLAWGIGARSTPRQIVKAWMRSPAHRATILGNWRYGAVATIADTPMPGLQTSGVTVVQHFGR